jgi:hypothetical protein
MTHDPYQTYQSLGAYSGLTNPFTSPYAAMQTNPLVGNIGMPWAGALAAQSALQNPFVAALLHQPTLGLQNVLQNPLQNQLLNSVVAQNPVLAQIAAQAYQQALQQQAYQQQPYQQQPFQHNPYQQIGHIGQPFAQQGLPFSQFNNPFVQSIAPQSWVGQGQGQGQINPLVLQSIARTLQPQGISPWGMF